MSRKTQIRALMEFNERVRRLDASALAERMEDPHYGIDQERVMKGEWISFDGVTQEGIDAFILNARLLIQDQDGFSIRRLAEDVYADDSVPPELRRRFEEERKRWRQRMDGSTDFSRLTEDRNFTNTELFDILLYGGLAHSNPKKVVDFYRVTRQGMCSSFVFGWFVTSLRILLGVVRAIRDINVELLSHWKQ